MPRSTRRPSPQECPTFERIVLRACPNCILHDPSRAVWGTIRGVFYLPDFSAKKLDNECVNWHTIELHKSHISIGRMLIYQRRANFGVLSLPIRHFACPKIPRNNLPAGKARRVVEVVVVLFRLLADVTLPQLHPLHRGRYPQATALFHVALRTAEDNVWLWWGVHQPPSRNRRRRNSGQRGRSREGEIGRFYSSGSIRAPGLLRGRRCGLVGLGGITILFPWTRLCVELQRSRARGGAEWAFV